MAHIDQWNGTHSYYDNTPVLVVEKAIHVLAIFSVDRAGIMRLDTVRAQSAEFSVQPACMAKRNGATFAVAIQFRTQRANVIWKISPAKRRIPMVNCCIREQYLSVGNVFREIYILRNNRNIAMGVSKTL